MPHWMMLLMHGGPRVPARPKGLRADPGVASLGAECMHAWSVAAVVMQAERPNAPNHRVCTASMKCLLGRPEIEHNFAHHAVRAACTHPHSAAMFPAAHTCDPWKGEAGLRRRLHGAGVRQTPKGYQEEHVPARLRICRNSQNSSSQNSSSSQNCSAPHRVSSAECRPAPLLSLRAWKPRERRTTHETLSYPIGTHAQTITAPGLRPVLAPALLLRESCCGSPMPSAMASPHSPCGTWDWLQLLPECPPSECGRHASRELPGSRCRPASRPSCHCPAWAAWAADDLLLEFCSPGCAPCNLQCCWSSFPCCSAPCRRPDLLRHGASHRWVGAGGVPLALSETGGGRGAEGEGGTGGRRARAVREGCPGAATGPGGSVGPAVCEGGGLHTTLTHSLVALLVAVESSDSSASLTMPPGFLFGMSMPPATGQGVAALAQ